MDMVVICSQMSVKELILHTFKGYALEGRFEGLCSQHQQVFPTVLIPLFIEHGNIYIYIYVEYIQCPRQGNV